MGYGKTRNSLKGQHRGFQALPLNSQETFCGVNASWNESPPHFRSGIPILWGAGASGGGPPPDGRGGAHRGAGAPERRDGVQPGAAVGGLAPGGWGCRVGVQNPPGGVGWYQLLELQLLGRGVKGRH